LEQIQENIGQANYRECDVTKEADHTTVAAP